MKEQKNFKIEFMDGVEKEFSPPPSRWFYYEGQLIVQWEWQLIDGVMKYKEITFPHSNIRSFEMVATLID